MATPDGSGPAPKRRRTFTWHDPSIGAAAAARMAGLDYLRAILKGDLPGPPIASLLGFKLRDVESGRVVYTAEPAEHHYNPIGMVHGGLAAALCDSAAGCAIHTLLPAGTGYTTLELKINFVRPLSIGRGAVTCEGKVLHLGKRSALAEARVVDGEWRLCAHATCTCLLVSEKPRA